MPPAHSLRLIVNARLAVTWSVYSPCPGTRTEASSSSAQEPCPRGHGELLDPPFPTCGACMASIAPRNPGPRATRPRDRRPQAIPARLTSAPAPIASCPATT